MRIYVASSWRNTRQPSVVVALREAGHEVYDFRHPHPGDDGFSWREIDGSWQSWTPEQYRAALKHPAAIRGFGFDMTALNDCDACVLVLPCGRSAHLELGHAAGAGRRTFVLLEETPRPDAPMLSEPELMYGMCSGIAVSLEELLEQLASVGPATRTPSKE